MTLQSDILRDLGWSPSYQSQLDIDEIESLDPARIISVHRSSVDVISAGGERRVDTGPDLSSDRLAVGDWVLLNRDPLRLERLLERQTLLQRRGAGTARDAQLIAANVDTLFIVSSCNADFNIARLERYMALAMQAHVQPVVVLTKADMCDDSDAYRDRLRGLSPDLISEVVNARDPSAVERLIPWCGRGQTVAFAGSSGVGKSTLSNALTGGNQETQGIREDDARGRHTTTVRLMQKMDAGGWLIDMPGMRAVRLLDVEEGVAAVFGDIEELGASCRFGDCAHSVEPGCAVQAAIDAGELDPDRLERWRKLKAEDNRNSASIAEKRRHSRQLGRIYREAKMESRSRKGGR
ncbi:ribosome small subunit-dependent GTPase A [Amaricoccus tamworthensis]|uniref:ribosome small subunit-dependent GTPase A n=1 Tax=Amaricoccus tamworthensis TaxID=57002 RepID=UPI003C7A8CF4